MSIIDSLIIDRTSADVNYINSLNKKGISRMTDDELNTWLHSLKGSYNATDMNRVETAVEYIAQRLNDIGYNIQLQTKTDWSLSDTPTPEDLQRYANNVLKIRSVLVLEKSTPDAPDSAERLTYEEANDIERILLAVDEMIQNIQDTIDLGWVLGMAHVGLYAAALSLRLLTEDMALMVDKRDQAPDLLKLPEGTGQIIFEYAGENYRCEVK